MPRSPRPDLNGILRLKAVQEAHWEPAHAKQRQRWDLYMNEHDVEPPDFPESQIIGEPYMLRAGRAPEMVNSAVGLLDVDARHSIDAPGLGERVHKRTEKAEKWANSYRSLVNFEQGENIDNFVTFETVLHGISGVKVLPNPSLWRGKWPRQGEDDEGELPGEIPGATDPDTGREVTQDQADERYNRRVDRWLRMAPFPVSVWHIPATTWFPVLDGRNVVQSLEVTQVTPAWIKARYGNQLQADELRALDNMQSNETLEFLAYVDDAWAGWYCHHLGAQFSKELRLWRHQMPVPEGRAPAVGYYGVITPDPRPLYRFQGLLDPVMEALVAQDMVLSRHATMVLIYFWLTIIRKQTGEGGAMQSGQVKNRREFNFGGVVDLVPGEDLDVLGPPQNLPDAEALYQKLEERLRMHWPPVLQGVIEGKSSGYLYQLMRDTSLTKVKPIASHLAQGDADTFRMVAYAIGGLGRLLRRPKLTVYVRWADAGNESEHIGLSYDDIKDMLPLVRASRDADLPVDEASQLDNVGKAMDLGMPKARAWERYGKVEDPETMEDEKIGEELQASDPIRKRREEKVLEEMDLLEDELEGEDPAVALANSALPPAFAEALATGMGDEGGTPEMAGMPLDQGLAGSPEPVAPSPGRISYPSRSGTRTRPGGPRMRGGGPSAGGEST